MQPTNVGPSGPDQVIVLDDLPILNSVLRNGNVNDLLQAQGMGGQFDNVKRHFAADDE